MKTNLARERHLLFLAPTTTYRLQPFLEAAQQLGIDVTVGCDRCHVLAKQWSAGPLPLNFHEPEEAVQQIFDFAKGKRFDAILGADDLTTVIAAQACAALSLPHNSVESVYAARNKYRMRELLAAASIPNPRFSKYSVETASETIADEVRFPCVLKPLLLSGSRGVMRANHRDEFIAAFQRLARLLRSREFFAMTDPAAREIQVEEFIPGVEVAVEGILTDGNLELLALFDKPDPLDGPFFEETIYVTPSRLPRHQQNQIMQAVARAANALGLRTGPVHAELRLNAHGPWVIEIAARTIGGLCSRTLRFGTNLSLEELIIRHALGLEINALEREAHAAGVMMIPISRAGRLQGVRGLERVRELSGIEEVTITAPMGHLLVPLPEGGSYLGFIFARGEQPEHVESALRAAHDLLEFDLQPILPAEE